MQLNGHVLHIG